MTADEELNDLIAYIRSWYRSRLKQHRLAGLPETEYNIAVKRYRPFLQRANLCYKEQQLLNLRSMAKELLYFVDPWEVISWYALNKKKTD